MNRKYIDMIYSDVHLEHHGVLGQKWGVENGPPYPLGRDVREALSNGEFGTLKSTLKESSGNKTNNDKKAFEEDEKKLKEIFEKEISALSYKNFTKLQSYEVTKKTKQGSCHDQTVYLLNLLRDNNIKAEGKFFMEVEGNQGYETHSFVIANINNKFYWLENAWEDQKGIREYKTKKDLLDDVKSRVEVKKNRKLVWGKVDLKNHKMDNTESLQDFVNICLE